MNTKFIVFSVAVFALSLLVSGEPTAALRDETRDHPVAGAAVDAAPIRLAQTHQPKQDSRSQGGTGAVSSATAGKQGSGGRGASGAADSAVRNWVGFRGGKQGAGR